MSAPPAKLLVYVADKVARVKIIGRANVAASLDFKRLVDELTLEGIKCFAIDLSDCLLMDSTFLGVLAGFGMKSAAMNGDGEGLRIELDNPNARISELLENLGVAHLFTIHQGVAAVEGDAVEKPVTQHPREEVTRTCLLAHENLMELDAANVARFKDVARFLAEDLKKIKAAK